MKIGQFTIESGGEPFIVAEAGINHNGEMKLAVDLIRAARAAGADAVKFQTFTAEEFVSDPGQTYTYQSQGKEVTESMLEMFRRCEFTSEEWRRIKEVCDAEGILFLSTPQNRSDLELLLMLGIPAVKVGSDDLTNLPLLKSYAQTGLPLILSCGMASLSEVHDALEAVGALDGYPTVLLLCTSQYPTPPVDVNLRRLDTIRQAFPSVVPGFSDHTQGWLAAGLALALGAMVFEKHFTLDHNLPGPDHWFSADPMELREWVRAIRTAETMMGIEEVRATAAEEEMKVLARRSLVILREVAAGERLTERNLGLKRPGHGLPPAFIEQVYGTTARRALPKGHVLRIGDFQ